MADLVYMRARTDEQSTLRQTACSARYARPG
jgi:hypothetical protein